ncbi:MAG: TonB family protein [Hyphomonadaceae bacterium]|nr:TonB family protein [Hyphomonadaceae bacterium]
MGYPGLGHGLDGGQARLATAGGRLAASPKGAAALSIFSLRSRLSLLVPAAIATLASYFVMNWLVSVEFEEPPLVETRQLVPITPQQADTPDEPRKRMPVQRLPAATQPPPPPQLSTAKSDIDLPAASIDGAAPSGLDFASLDHLVVAPVVINEREAQPISPPAPVYPSRAAERGLEGRCEVHFDVNARGEPFNLNAMCSDSVFKRSAEEAVSRVRFAPKIVRGQAVERRSVVYPIEYGLDD